MGITDRMNLTLAEALTVKIVIISAEDVNCNSGAV